MEWPKTNPYAQPDSEDKIVYDADDELTNLPRIKYATLDKLIERVTFAKYPGTSWGSCGLGGCSGVVQCGGMVWSGLR